MTKNITHREWEALSAFLDNQLSEKDRFRLEARLKQDAELQTALDGLRKTRMVLRSQPRIRAPRNFTLTPAMVSQKGKERSLPRSYPLLRMASAFASLLFIFFFVTDLFAAAPLAPQQDFATTREEMERRAMAPDGYGEAVQSFGGMGSAESAAPEDMAPPSDPGLLAMPQPAPGEGERSVKDEGEMDNAMTGMGGGIMTEASNPSLIPDPYRRGIQVALLALAVLAGLAAMAVRRTAG